MKMPKLKTPKFMSSNARIKSIDAPKTWLVKTVVFGALLTGAGVFLGFVMKWVGGGYAHFVPGTWDLAGALQLAFLAIGAIATVAVTAALVAILIRPFWVAALEMLASAIVLFLCWQISLTGFVVALIYFLVGMLYLAGVRAEISNRIQFRVWNIRTSQGMLLALLVALVCTSLYFGYAKNIDKEGFTLSPGAIDWMVDMADQHVVDTMMPPTSSSDDRVEALKSLRLYLENDLHNGMEPYKGYAPVLLATGAFSVLTLAMLVLSWVPLLVLWIIFFILLHLKVIKKKAHPVEVTRLSIE